MLRIKRTVFDIILNFTKLLKLFHTFYLPCIKLLIINYNYLINVTNAPLCFNCIIATKNNLNRYNNLRAVNTIC